jgi:hypothetical protein
MFTGGESGTEKGLKEAENGLFLWILAPFGAGGYRRAGRGEKRGKCGIFEGTGETGRKRDKRGINQDYKRGCFDFDEKTGFGFVIGQKQNKNGQPVGQLVGQNAFFFGWFLRGITGERRGISGEKGLYPPLPINGGVL